MEAGLAYGIRPPWGVNRGKRLKRLRKQAGLSRVTLCGLLRMRKVKVCPHTVMGYEHNKHGPPFWMLEELLYELDFPIKDWK